MMPVCASFAMSANLFLRLALYVLRLFASQRFMEDLKDDGMIENQPSMQGRTMFMIMAPQKV